MKKIKLLMISFLWGWCGFVEAQPYLNLCLSGKVEKTLPTYKVAFLNGANLAISKYKMQNKVKIKTYFYGGDPLLALDVYQKMLKDKCSVVIGYEYLTDLLLVEKMQKNIDTPIFTSYSSFSQGDYIPKNIFIFSPSYDFQARKMVSFLERKFKVINDFLIITEVNRAALVRYTLAYQKIFNKKKVSYENFNFLEYDGNLVKNLSYFIKGKKYNYVLLMCGAVASAKIANLMNNHKIVFVGTENFGSSTNPSLYTKLLNKNIHAYSIRNIDFLNKDKNLIAFEESYFTHYHIKPSPLSLYTYDSVAFVLHAFKNYGYVTMDSLLDSNFKFISGAYVKNKLFYHSKKYVILSIGRNGVKYEE